MMVCCVLFRVILGGGVLIDWAESSCHEDVPFINHIIGLAPDPNSAQIFGQYQKVLAEAKKSSRRHGRNVAYNFIMTTDWIVLVPRSTKGRDDTPTNAAGILGMVWVRSDEERARWTELGMSEYLASLAIPRDEKIVNGKS
jgi:ATP adenylyltransferase